MNEPGKKEEGMRKMFRKAEAGFTLIEMLIVVLIVGVLAAVAAPLYLGYTKDAKLAEGKAVTGSLWTSWQAAAQQNCGIDQPITVAYTKAGLTPGGATQPARWTVGAAGDILNISCAGVYTLTPATGIITTGTAADLSTSLIRLSYPATGVKLECSIDAVINYQPC